MRNTVWPIVRLCTGFAMLHSLLAARPVKEAVAHLAGDRYRNGLYRGFYNVQAGISSAWVVYQIIRLPDRRLYEVPPPFAWLLRLGQGLSVLLGLRAALAVGIPQLSGLAELAALAQERPVAPEPEAQGPPPAAEGAMQVSGPFAVTRHPLNWAPLLFFPLFPRMTQKRATVAVMVVLYTLLGSVHEEIRLRARYGAAYRRYQEQVPFLVPRGPWSR